MRRVSLRASRDAFRCELTLRRNSLFLRTILTGFFTLEQAGLLNLTVNFEPLAEYPPNILLAHLEDGRRLAYDTNDGYQFLLGRPDAFRWFDDVLGTVDAYFKATLIPDMHGGLVNATKIQALGILSGFHSSPANPLDEGLRSRAPRTALRNLVGRSAVLSDLLRQNNRHMRPREYERPPSLAPVQRAIYVAGLWNPNAAEVENADVRLERERLNLYRAELVRCARAELGPRFVGGLVPTPYALAKYPDCVVRSPETTNRWCYLKTMRTSAVGIATSGLHSCANGKLTEYLAASRAVVSETLRIVMPGDFAAPSNYLEAKRPEECVASAARLLSSPQAVREMMRRNWEYYQRYLRPDAMVMRTLLDATEAKWSILGSPTSSMRE